MVDTGSRPESAEISNRRPRSADLLDRSRGSTVAGAVRMSIETASPEFLAGDLTGAIIRAFFQTDNDLGSGFPEHIARRALAMVMREAGLLVEEEVTLPVWFHGTRIATFRADLIVAARVIVEVKATRELEKFHSARVAHYPESHGSGGRTAGQLRFETAVPASHCSERQKNDASSNHRQRWFREIRAD
jgi:GxxExxY protein